jgi:hypothetical protein
MPRTYPYARTDSDFTPLPNPLPSFGAAGSIFTDPSFNPAYPPTYVRVTDPSTFVGWNGIPASFTVGTGSGDDIHFNTTDTLLWLTNEGAGIFIFSLVPDTLQITLLCQISSDISWGNGHFSQVNPNLFYTINPQTGKLYAVDFSSPGNHGKTVSSAKEIFDFSKVINSGNTVFAGIGGGDTIFTAYFGIPDNPDCIQIAAYNAVTGKVSVYDTLSGTVDGNPISIPGRYYLHGAHLYDPTGQWMVATKSGGGLYAWAIGGNLVLPAGDYADGHAAGNAYGLFNNASYSPAGFPSLLHRRWTNFATGIVESWSPGNAPYNPILDSHPTQRNNPSGLEDLPVFASTYAPGTNLAYENEIMAWQKNGPILRFGSTFSTGTNLVSFQAQNAVGAVSQTGKFYAVTTDGEGTLNGRSDVFLLVLPGLG